MATPSRRAAGFVVALLLAPASRALTDFGLQPVQFVPLPETADPYRLRALDVTADGVPDLIEAPVTASDLHVLVGQGAFAFGAAVTTPSAGIKALDLGDLDGDGLPDIVRVPFVSHANLEVLLGNGAGGFVPAGAIDLADGIVVFDLRLLDADEDGDLDAFVEQATGVRIVPGDGAGGFAAPGPVLEAGQLGAAGQPQVADLNGDGHADVVVCGYAFFSTGWAVWAGDGAGGLSFAQVELTSPDGDVGRSELGDFDGDHLTDYLMTQYDYSMGDDQIVLARGTGSGLASPGPQSPFASPGADLVQVGDLDGDGFDDLAGTSSTAGTSQIWVKLGQGDFSFASPTFSDVESPYVYLPDLDLADLDGNGVLDVAVLQNDPPRIALFASTSLPAGWSDLGHALAGSAGVPVLAGAGSLTAGAPVSLALTSAKPLAPVILVLGASALDQPFKGGVLVPHPDALVMLVTGAAGSVAGHGKWPPGLVPAATIRFQAWIPDAAGPAGFAASNALAAKVAPD